MKTINQTPNPDGKKMTTSQRKSVEYILRELPHHGEEVYEWKVEDGSRSVFLFASTRIKDERGAQVLCRERYLFQVGTKGGIKQLSPDRKRVDIRRPGMRW